MSGSTWETLAEEECDAIREEAQTFSDEEIQERFQERDDGIIKDDGASGKSIKNTRFLEALPRCASGSRLSAVQEGYGRLCLIWRGPA